MSGQKQKRRRGVILTPQGLKKLQAAKAEAEICENLDKHYTLEALSSRTCLDPDTLMKVFSCEAGVDKRSLNRCFRAFNLLLEQSDYDLPSDQVEKVEDQVGATAKMWQDWGEAPDVSVFYGRTQELAQMKQWIVENHCRLIVVLGIGGMGKTFLSVKLAQQVQDEFEFVVWRSLRYETPVKDILAELIRFLSKESETDLPATVEGRISRLIDFLRASRCLLILDNAETILQAYAPQKLSYSDRTGHYCKDYQGYGELLRRVGEARHQSCLLLTSRQKPKKIGILEGKTLPVRVLQLKGLHVVEVQEIFRGKGSFWASPNDWLRLIDYYEGNPLVLKIVATTIQNLFAGNISEFLRHSLGVFGDLRNLLEEQFEPLLNVEKEIIKWLAVNRQPASFSVLRDQLVPALVPQTLLEALESLEERSLIEKSSALFSLQPMVMEYANEQFIEDKIAEIRLKVFSYTQILHQCQ